MAENMLARGAAWLAAKGREHAAVEVTYVRPHVGERTGLLATRGRSDVTVDRGDSYVETIRSDDWLIAPGDLVIAGQETLPAAGDLIHERTSSSHITHEVIQIGNEPVWRYTDSYRHRIRIHSKRVRVE